MCWRSFLVWSTWGQGAVSLSSCSGGYSKGPGLVCGMSFGGVGSGTGSEGSVGWAPEAGGGRTVVLVPDLGLGLALGVACDLWILFRLGLGWGVGGGLDMGVGVTLRYWCCQS